MVLKAEKVVKEKALEATEVTKKVCLPILISEISKSTPSSNRKIWKGKIQNHFQNYCNFVIFQKKYFLK